MLTIAIDFDSTLDRDPDLWRDFICNAKRMGHRVILVTCRRATYDNRQTVSDWLYQHDIDIPAYFTDLGSKIEKMKQVGVKVDIWIDDDPGCIIHGK